MIVVFAPLQREFIKELLHQKLHDEVTFHFEKQENMKLYFSCDSQSSNAVKVAKKVIKDSKYGSVLHFMVEEA